jgi:hypothetical protein
MIGLHTVTVGGIDVSCWVDEVATNYGRDESTGQPDAASATIDLTTDPDDPLPAAVEIGAAVVISTTLNGVTYRRFTGKLTDIALGWDDAGPDTPEAGIGQLVAVGALADLARRVVGDAPFPAELDGARVSRVLTLAGKPPDPAFSDPGTVQVLARDVDSQAALDVVQGTADSASGIVWETVAGEVRYADAAHRRGVTVALDLDACDVLVTPTWKRDLSGLVNGVSIGYGVAPDGGEQPRYVASNAESVARFGTFDYSLTTELAALADAQALGGLLLARNSSPVWLMTALPVDVAGLDLARSAVLLSLEMHSLVRLTGLPAIASAPTSALVWVEGWSDRLAWGVHEVELIVSGFCRTVPPPRWNDVPPENTWDTMPSSLTWDSAACMGPPANRGRWDDQPASTRWNMLDPALTWDTFGTGG